MIRDAAAQEFVEKGYHGTTLAAIAARAGVAVQTVYFVFHTKAELLSTVVDAAVVGPEAVAPEDADWFRHLAEQSDAAQVLRAFIEGGAPIFERAAGVFEVANGAARSDAEVKVIAAHHEHLRIEGCRRVVNVVEAKSPLRHELTTQRATDILATVVSPQLYLTLVEDHGWAHDEVVNWWLATIPRLLLPNSDDRAGS